MASNQPADFSLLPWVSSRRVLEHVADSSNISSSINSSRALPPLLPSIGSSSRQLREEYASVHFEEMEIIVDLSTGTRRKNTGQWLAIHGDLVINNARQITIRVFEEDPQGHSLGKTVGIALGGRSVSWTHLAGTMATTSGHVRVGETHVVFSCRDTILCNTVVARQLATATNEILASHGPDPLARISLRELQQVVGVLNDIEGMRFGGLGDGWVTDHVDLGVAADFWSMFD